MNIIRFTTGTATAPRIGILDGDLVRELRAASLAELLRESADAFRRLLQEDRTGGASHALADVRLLAPIDGRTEVWAAGVTYKLSQQERMKESEGAALLYQQIYDAERPELFFKSAAWRVRGPGETIAARADSAIDVPEPELALVLNARGEICGYTVCNDVSSRTIEGENPLYLPQAKIYLGGCALGPTIRPAWEVPDPYDLAIRLAISRDGADLWSGSASTAGLHRRFGELVDHLLRADVFPDGVVLSTGTSLVPELPFSLADGDVVSIDIENVGTLVNPVVRGRPDL
ncbi:MAG TPA: fumarylacetoacetate hydrolase family protein [Trebonia sp.]|jgi:2-dehydro-3-deoxy-D-arabinonate dehydratase|nr:fumarylacetoacetate hydrolase family protein [Trebonia sp.]